MGRIAKTTGSHDSGSGLRPVLTDEARESRAISLAMDRAEEQLVNGTASSQIIVHFLKLGTAKANLEREKLARENELLRAKTDALESAKRVEELYANALNAMRKYNGMDGGSDEEEYDEY